MAKRNEKRKYRWVRTVVLVLLLCRGANWYRYTRGHVPLTTLPVSYPSREEIEADIGEISYSRCPNVGDIRYGLLGNPQISPDGQFFVLFIKGSSNKDTMWMYDTKGQVFGFYTFKALRFCGWSSDGLGVYVMDYIPGRSALFPLEWPELLNPGYVSPIKKVLIPCAGPLVRVALLPPLYWGMRCLFPDPFHPLAVWVPLVVMVLGVGAAIGYGYRLWRTPGVQSRVEKGLERLDRWWQNLKWRLFMRL